MSATLRHRRGVIDFSDGPALVGIVNVTPDSFSDGGRFLDPANAVAHAVGLVASGASILDVGGESTRPGAAAVPDDEQIARVVPVIERLVDQTDAIVSVDTTSAAVADAALRAGADIVNDISGLTFDAALSGVVAQHGAGLIVMHTPGRPSIMQTLASYGDVTRTVRDSLRRSIDLALAAGVAADGLAVDPGFGFGKNAAHNAALFARLGEIVALGFPVMVGVSRKRMLRELVGDTEADLDVATAVAGLVAAQRGAAMLRVHNVAASRAALQTWSALAE
jgi:dihydropteroate synthase